MGKDDFDHHLQLIRQDDPHYLQKTWESSARFFFAEAVKGRDIGEAIEALQHCYHEASQIGVLRAAAAAIAVYDLRCKDVSHLRALLLKAKYKDWVIEGIEDAFEKKLDLGPAIPLLIEFFSARQYIIVKLLSGQLQRGADFAAMAQAVADGAPAHLPDFLTEAHSSRIDITPALPLLAAQLCREKLGERAATNLSWMAQTGIDITSILPDLEKYIDAPKGDLAARIVFGLTFHYTAMRDWERVDSLLHADSQRTRSAASRALGVRLLNNLDDIRAVVDRVVSGLLSDIPETRAQSLSTLMEAQNKKLRVRPAKEVLVRLVAALDATIAEFLYVAVPAADLVTLLENADSPEAKRLRRICEQPLPTCSICVRLPRNKSWSDESNLPPEINKLQSRGGLRRCPECGRYYTYCYQEEWEDLRHSQTWSLTRLTPPQVLQLETDKEALATFRSKYDATIAQRRAELDHPRLEVRSEAAFDVAAHLIFQRDWAGLRDMLRSCEGPLRLRALEVVESSGLDPGQIADLLEDDLNDPNDELCNRAAMLLAERVLKQNQEEALHRLLASSRQAVLRAVLGKLFGASKSGFDVSPFFARLSELRQSPDSNIRNLATWLLSALGAKAKKVDPLPLFLEDLACDDVKRRIQAASAIKDLARVRKDAVQAIPHLLPMLRDKETVFYALEALKAFLEARAPLDAAVPVLIEQATARVSSRRPDILYFLQKLGQTGIDLRPHHPELAKLLSADEQSRRTVLQLFEDAPGNLAAVEEPLRAALSDPEAYLREVAARLLARYYIKKSNVAGLRFLLRHERSEVVSMCSDALASSRVEIGLLPDLLALLDHKKEYVREHVADAILNLARKKRAAVEAALRNQPDSPALAKLKKKLQDYVAYR